MSQAVPTEQDWVLHKERIIQLYRTERRTLFEVMATILRDHGFRGTEAQYKKKLREWDIQKNISKKKMLKVLRKREQRLSEGKKVEFYYMGQPLGEKINRAESRYGAELMTAISPMSSEISGIECFTQTVSSTPSGACLATGKSPARVLTPMDWAPGADTAHQLMADAQSSSPATFPPPSIGSSREHESTADTPVLPDNGPDSFIALLASFFNDDPLSEDIFKYHSPQGQVADSSREADTWTRRSTSPNQRTAQSASAPIALNCPSTPSAGEVTCDGVNDNSPPDLLQPPIPAEWEEGFLLNLIIKDFRPWDDKSSIPRTREGKMSESDDTNSPNCENVTISAADSRLESPPGGQGHQLPPRQQDQRLSSQPLEANEDPDTLMLDYSILLKALRVLMGASSNSFDENFRTHEIMDTIESVFDSHRMYTRRRPTDELMSSSDSYFIQATSAWEKRKLGQALECYIRALYGYRTTDTDLMIAATYGGISSIYSEFSGDPDKVLRTISNTEQTTRGLETIKKAWEVYQGADAANSITEFLRLTRMPLFFMGRFEKPLEIYNQLFAGYEESESLYTLAFIDFLKEDVIDDPDHSDDPTWKIFYKLSRRDLQNPAVLIQFVRMSKIHDSLGIPRMSLQQLWHGIKGLIQKYGHYFPKALLLIVAAAYFWERSDFRALRETYNRYLVGYAKLEKMIKDADANGTFKF